MVKRALLCTILLAAVVTGASISQSADQNNAPPPVELGMAKGSETAVVEETFAFQKPDSDPAATITPALLREIIGWLGENFDLPASTRLPNIAFSTPARMAALRYPGLLDRHEQSAAGSDTVAIYEAATRTIHLPVGWRGATPAEMSVLVHEVVHHLQHTARLPFACPQEREQLAYRAQQRWLQRFGRSLASEFGTDGFTLLVRTNCGF
jgi:hypothetical protein